MTKLIVSFRDFAKARKEWFVKADMLQQWNWLLLGLFYQYVWNVDTEYNEKTAYIMDYRVWNNYNFR